MAEIIKDMLGLAYSPVMEILDNTEVTTDIILEEIDEVETGQITGVVTDGTNPVPDATVKIFDENDNPIAHTKTDDEGKYSIHDVSFGSYRIGVYAKGCELPAKKLVIVQSGMYPEANFTVKKNLNVANAFVAGRISAVGGTWLGRVKVVVKKDNVTVQETATANDGEFMLTNLEDSDYEIEIYKNGYKQATDEIKIKVLGGGFYNIDLFMNHVGRVDIKGTINGCVRDKSGMPILGCLVGLYVYDKETRKERLVNVQEVNSAGQYFFGDCDGDYKVKAMKKKKVIV